MDSRITKWVFLQGWGSGSGRFSWFLVCRIRKFFSSNTDPTCNHGFIKIFSSWTKYKPKSRDKDPNFFSSDRIRLSWKKTGSGYSSGPDLRIEKKIIYILGSYTTSFYAWFVDSGLFCVQDENKFFISVVTGRFRIRWKNQRIRLYSDSYPCEIKKFKLKIMVCKIKFYAFLTKV